MLWQWIPLPSPFRVALPVLVVVLAAKLSGGVERSPALILALLRGKWAIVGVCGVGRKKEGGGVRQQNPRSAAGYDRGKVGLMEWSLAGGDGGLLDVFWITVFEVG